jgi:hypothetical protein
VKITQLSNPPLGNVVHFFNGLEYLVEVGADE